MGVNTFLKKRSSKNWSCDVKHFKRVNFIVQCDNFAKLCCFSYFTPLKKPIAKCENWHFKTWKKTGKSFKSKTETFRDCSLDYLQ